MSFFSRNEVEHDLYTAILEVFADIERPQPHQIVHPFFLDGGVAFIAEANLAVDLITNFDWHEIQLRTLHLAEELCPGRHRAAQSAQSFFELLSNFGIAYFTPAAMLIVLAEGRAAEPLFQGILDKIDPDWVGPDEVQAAFAQWDKGKISVLLRFVDWGCSEFLCRSYEGQDRNVRKHWNDHLERISMINVDAEVDTRPETPPKRCALESHNDNEVMRGSKPLN
jgi:hypothetical protein